jgi:gluconate 5-dehydrogenase
MTIWDRFRLDGKRALITGGTRGLGFAMAHALAEAGADLILIGRDPEHLEQAAKDLSPLGRRIDCFAFDVATPAGAEAMCERVLAGHDPVHILINNVGSRRVSVPTENLSLEDWQKTLDLNLTSAFVCCQLVGREMVRRRSGRIINVASIAGPVVIKGIHGRAYETAKAALIAFTKTLAADWSPYNVGVNAILPGGFATEAVLKRFADKPDWQKTFLGQIPMGRLGQPEELGPLAVYLASDASSYMTGSAVVIDGGYTLW